MRWSSPVLAVSIVVSLMLGTVPIALLAQAQETPETTKYLLTNESVKTLLYKLWKLRETNPEYSEDLTTKAEVMKSAVCTYFVFRPGLEICYTNFPGIERKKEGWMLPKEEKDFLTNTSYDSEDPVSSALKYSGQRLTISGKWVQSVTFLLKKVGNPSGICDATIRKPDGTGIVVSNTVDVGTIPDTFTEVTFYYTSPKYINEDVIFWFEYPGGSSTDYISCAYLKSDVISGHYCRGPTGLIEYPDYDAYIKANEIVPFNGSFPAGDWTFRVRFESDSDYGFSVKVSSRVSKSTDVEGKDGTLVAITESPNIIDIPASIGGSVSDTWTWNAPEITLDDEFLFIEFRIHIEVVAGSRKAMCSFACDEDPSVADESVETTVFSEGPPPTNVVPEVLNSYTPSSVDPNSAFDVNVEVRDNDNISDIDEVWLKIFENAKVQGDSDSARDHYTFKWVRGSGFSEVGPDAGGSHINTGSCVVGNDAVTTDNFLFNIKLGVTASPNNSWNVWAKVIDSASAQDSEEFANRFSVNEYTSLSIDDAALTFSGNPGGMGEAASENPTLATASANVDFNIQVKLNGDWSGSTHGGSIAMANTHADQNGSSPWNLDLSAVYQNLWSVGWGEDVQRDCYWFLDFPLPLRDDVYSTTFYVSVVKS